jgi:hypothetical protein
MMRLLYVLLFTFITMMMLGATACGDDQPPQEDPPPANGEVDTPTDVPTDVPVELSAGNTDISVVPGDSANATEDEAGSNTEPPEIDLTNLIETESLPERWPDYIPIMDGLECIYGVDALDVPEEPLIGAILSGDKPVLEMAEFYLNLDGWVADVELELPAPTEEYFVGVFYRDDDKALQIEGGVYEDGTSGVNLIMLVGDLEEIMEGSPL